MSKIVRIEEFWVEASVSYVHTAEPDGAVVPGVIVTPAEDERWMVKITDVGNRVALVVWAAGESLPRYTRIVHVGPVPYDGPMGVKQESHDAQEGP